MSAITASLLVGLILPQISGALPPAKAAVKADKNKHTQVMTYEVYAGGINALTAELVVRETPHDNYFLSLEAATKGFLGKLAPWKGIFETKGVWRDDGTATPEMHRSIAIWRGEKETKEYLYDQTPTLTDYTVIEDGRDKTPKKIDKKLTDGTIDAMTATLSAMKQTVSENDCSGSAEVFDGKRRYELVFTRENATVFEPSKYNVYKGEAIECVVEVVPVAGKWREKPRGWMSIQEQGRDKGTLPTVWLAQINDTGPAVPVKIRVKTNYGTLYMHLKEYRNGKLRLSARK